MSDWFSGHRKFLAAFAVMAAIVSGLVWVYYKDNQTLVRPRNEVGPDQIAGSFGIGIQGYVGYYQGGEKDNEIFGSAGIDNMFGGAGDDKIQGQRGADFINGEAGDDELAGGEGRDIVMGGEGNDTIKGAEDYEVIDGGDGYDTLVLPHKFPKFVAEDQGNGNMRFKGPFVDSIVVKNIERVIREPAPMQGPYKKPKSPISNMF